MGLCLYLLYIHFIFIVEATQLYDYTPKYRFVTYMCVELFCLSAFFFKTFSVQTEVSKASHAEMSCENNANL